MKKTHIQDFTKSELLQNFHLIKELKDEKVTLFNTTTSREYPLMSCINDCKRFLLNKNIGFKLTKISEYESWGIEDTKEMRSLDGICIELTKQVGDIDVLVHNWL